MENTSHTDDLKAIRKIMEESSRFLSLSGLSGVFAGIFAITGCIIAILLLKNTGLPGSLKLTLFIDAIVVLSAALLVAVFLSWRKAKRTGNSIWTLTTRQMLVSLFIPLLSGGLFILVFYLAGDYKYIIPSMLVFYGIALLSAGKYTFGEIQYLGILQIICGFISIVFPSYALYLWGFGFGILHILYGLIMHKKYR